MSQLSRRDFLKIVGVTAVGVQFDWPFAPQSVPTETHGRTFAAAAVYEAPTLSSPVITRLWPDSIAPIIDSNGAWYRLAQGYVQRTDVQPILLQAHSTVEASHALPFWAEVSSPIAVVQEWCAADAPVVTRIGFGGTLQVVDFLPATGGLSGWYGVASAQGNLLGWTQAVHWRVIDESRKNTRYLTLQIDQLTQRIIIFERERAIMRAPISTGKLLENGIYPVKRHEVGGISHETLYGASWPLYFGAEDQGLAGVYWHNRFGQSIPGLAVQVLPFIAKWLYMRGVDEIRVS